ncbi:hypothetical protein [Sediminibacillus albus]|uniref:Hook-length control protein FliK n=1 Tax=Sediminibacillus albus TaxID=407036 RepID=A0A1G8W4V5_9BACI|nr:hypothetical protein [Sediminibacillus albus]SDJ72765.1 hypothetical protein SAMN05216243_0532 [Sediminibacillus albus]
MAGTNPAASKLFDTLHNKMPAQQSLSLKPGQILAGKVLKLYPDQKASIQLGNQQMVAQLEAPLTVKDNYWFQVQSVGQFIRLKILSNRPADQSKQAISKLFEELGLKETKTRSALLRQLLIDKIPFQKESLGEAFKLLEGSIDKQTARQIIMQMFHRKLPVTPSVYKAVKAINENAFGDLLSTVQSNIKASGTPTANQAALAGKISQFTFQEGNSLDVQLRNQIIKEVNQEKQVIFQLLKKTEMLPSTVRFADWQENWRSWQNSQSASTVPPFTLQGKETQWLSNIEQLQLMQLPENSKQAVAELLQLSDKLAKSSLTANEQQRLAGLQMQILKEAGNKAFPLTDGQKETIRQSAQTASISREAVQLLKSIADKQLSPSIAAALSEITAGSIEGQKQLASNPKQYFLAKLEQIFQGSGINHEYELAKANLDNLQSKDHSLKSLLLQSIQDSTSSGKGIEKLDTLLHFLNGIQLTNQQEAGNFLQINLQLPGDKIGMKKDISIDIEGQKDESGKINPDFCHILFYLDLEKMEETVVDMNIQKRMVSITVYNNNEQLDRLFSFFKPALQQGLKNLDYHLSSVQLKPLESNSKELSMIQSDTGNDRKQGVDYRI